MALEMIEFKPRKINKKEEVKEDWRSQAYIAKYFHVSPATVSRWVNDPYNPLPRTVKNGVKRIDLNAAKKWFGTDEQEA